MYRRRVLSGLPSFALSSVACGGRARSRRGDDGTVVFKHQPLWGDPERFRALLQRFRSETGIEVVPEALPSSSDAAHQFFLTALEGGEPGFDVLVADVVWIAEFARAGWIADLSPVYATERIRREFIRGAADAVIVEGTPYAVPWYADVGLMLRRADLVPEPARTYEDLVASALGAVGRGACDHGVLWQGRQYEGLVCNAMEAIWGHGGTTSVDGRVQIDTAEARAALGYLRSLVSRGASPRSVTAMAEEESRRPFQAGRAAFLRSWPYAVVEAERPGSEIAGRVAVDPLPTIDGAPGSGTLGGYQLAVTSAATGSRRDRAIAFIEHMTSTASNVELAVAYGRNPARLDAYDDEALRARAPAVAVVASAIARARPRPVTAYYALIADTLQSELSAAVSGIRSPAQALSRAQRACDRIMGGGGP